MKLGDALLDVVGRDLEQSLDRELLDGERSHRRPVHHGATQARLGQIAATREIAHEAAGERVAGTGGIEHRLERIRRRKEDARRREHERAVLAFLDEHVLGPALHDPSRRLHEIELIGQLPRLGVVERDEVDVFEQLEQIGPPALDPEIHGVARHELGLRDLRQHVELQPRIDVAEEDERRLAELLGNLGAKVREHTKVRLQCFGDVEVVSIAAAPAKGCPLRPLEPRQIDRPRREGLLELVDRIVRSDDADELHRREVAGRRREEGPRPAEREIGAPKRRLHGIERNRTDDENAH